MGAELDAMDKWSNAQEILDFATWALVEALTPVIESVSRGGTRAFSTKQVADVVGCSEGYAGQALCAARDYDHIDVVADDEDPRHPWDWATARWRVVADREQVARIEALINENQRRRAIVR